MPCDTCGGTLTTEKTPNLVHYAKKKCSKCGRHDSWVQKPDKDGRQGTSSHSIEDIIRQKGYNEARCFFCQRSRNQLGTNETLERDHIKELKDGGKDSIDNIQVLCTACHKLKNHQYLYHNKHMYGGD